MNTKRKLIGLFGVLIIGSVVSTSGWAKGRGSLARPTDSTPSNTDATASSEDKQSTESKEGSRASAGIFVGADYLAGTGGGFTLGGNGQWTPSPKSPSGVDGSLYFVGTRGADFQFKGSATAMPVELDDSGIAAIGAHLGVRLGYDVEGNDLTNQYDASVFLNFGDNFKNCYAGASAGPAFSYGDILNPADADLLGAGGAVNGRLICAMGARNQHRVNADLRGLLISPTVAENDKANDGRGLKYVGELSATYKRVSDKGLFIGGTVGLAGNYQENPKEPRSGNGFNADAHLIVGIEK